MIHTLNLTNPVFQFGHCEKPETFLFYSSLSNKSKQKSLWNVDNGDCLIDQHSHNFLGFGFFLINCICHLKGAKKFLKTNIDAKILFKDQKTSIRLIWNSNLLKMLILERTF